MHNPGEREEARSHGACGQSPTAVKDWPHTQYPQIARQAGAEARRDLRGDEAPLLNTDVRGGRGLKLSMIATVTNQGKTRWMLTDGALNHEKLIKFFESLVKGAGKKIFLILDNLGVHHCEPVKAWLAENMDKMAVFYLPNYSSELNPEERLNAESKPVIRSKVPVLTKAKLGGVCISCSLPPRAIVSGATTHREI